MHSMRKIPANYGWENLLLLVVAERADIVHIVAPVFLDLDPSLEVDLCAHETLDIAAGLGRDLLEHRAVFADDDTLVARLFAVDGRVDLDDLVVAFDEARDLHGRAVWDLFIEVALRVFSTT